MTKFQVAIHYGETVGEVTFASGAITVALDDAKKAEVEAYLAVPHTISVPKDTIHDFEEKEFTPTESLDSFKVCMTRLWDATGVYVDWSRPVSGK